ncbi:MAG: Maf family protein, partial [Planctomycetes bacterium]|nr:Maf family protein [Planctomycetota bacterium]
LSQCTLHQECIILSADTVVILNGELIGKPRDHEHAKEILQKLQGSTHTVATAHCCLRPAYDDQVASEAIGLAISKVTMKPMSSDDINTYVASGESDNRAGAYAIQESGDKFVLDVEGDFDTVVGLNIQTVQRLYLQCCDHELKSAD